MINTLLLDLDGTVLSLDMDLFVKIYFSEMSKAFKDSPDQEKLIANVLAATEKTIKNTEYRTNEAVFMQEYSQLIKGELEEHKGRLDAFYESGYLEAKKSALPNMWMKKSIELLKAKGYTLVLATNPIFPANAIHHRIKWAGFEPTDFVYISSFENNHYCKPQIQYYEEVLGAIGKKPEECMMVGNDVQEDMMIAKLGVKTFLITDHLLHRTAEPIVVDEQGDYEAFYRFVTQLPDVINV